MTPLVVVALTALPLLAARGRAGRRASQESPAEPPPAQLSGAEPMYTVLSGVILNTRIRAFLDALAALLPGVRLVITSGYRSAEAQAAAMLKKLQAGENLYGLYTQDDLVDELYAAEPTVAAWTAVLQAQMARGRFISDHCAPSVEEADAVDIDVDDAGTHAAEIVAAAQSLGAEAIHETIRSHVHIEEIP